MYKGSKNILIRYIHYYVDDVTENLTLYLHES